MVSCLAVLVVVQTLLFSFSVQTLNILQAYITSRGEHAAAGHSLMYVALLQTMTYMPCCCPCQVTSGRGWTATRKEASERCVAGEGAARQATTGVLGPHMSCFLKYAVADCMLLVMCLSVPRT